MFRATNSPIIRSTFRLHIQLLVHCTDTAAQWRNQEFCSEGVKKFSSGQRKRGSGGGSLLVRGSGGSCNLVQEILISYSKIFLIFGTLTLFVMTIKLFVIANVKQF